MYRYIFNLFLRGQDPLAGLIKRIRDETRDTFMKCGYIRQTWDCGNTREVEEKHTGRYGARGQKRQKRRKATPEEIAKQNQWKRERDVRRLIKWNFGIGDYWFTLTYKKGSRPPWKQMQKDMSKFIRKLRDNPKRPAVLFKTQKAL